MRTLPHSIGALAAILASTLGVQAQVAPAPLQDDLGTHTRAVTTMSKHAQAYFDQGLRSQYAFNHEQAIASYRTALDADPACAMCWWGIALAAGPNINAPLTSDRAEVASDAIEQARRLASTASPLERELIEALDQRYRRTSVGDQAVRDSAYAAAMSELVDRHPLDADILTLYAASLMNLTPWNYWEGPFGERRPREGTAPIFEVLERALDLAPDHPGACHYYIHAVEAGAPEEAVACAERLAQLMPGAGHIVHMPGHIYIRVGRYRDAVVSNEHAVHSDETYLADVGAGTFYAGTYYPHSYHFMGFAATMAGMSERALQAARAVAPKVPPAVAKDFYWIQNAVVLPQLTLVNFGRWEEVLREPRPDKQLSQATILDAYARGVAQAALEDVSGALRILDSLRAQADALSDVDRATNPIPFIAPEALAGEIALRQGDAEAAVRHFSAAAEIEDTLLYDEPPLWYYPVRHSLGVALLRAGRPVEAERVYLEDLDRFPENGWSLYGLAESLRAQGRETEADAARARFEHAWADADVELEGSRF